MRLIIGSSSPPDRGGGINAYVAALISELAANGVDVHMVSPAPQDDAWLQSHGVIHCALGQDVAPAAAARRILKYIDAHAIDGIINNDHPFLQMIAPFSSVPFISVGHMRGTSVAALACHQHAWVDYVIAISADMRDAYVRKYGLPIEKVPIIYNGVTVPAAPPGGRDPARPLSIAFGGGSNWRKGSKRLLRALRLFPDEWARFELHWFGEVNARYREVLKKFPFVVVHGRLPRQALHRQLGRCDVLLLPSRSEGCPMLMLEAMSLGVVPVASNGRGAMERLIIHGQEGYICHLHAWERQSTSLVSYLSRHRDMLRHMGKRCIERCRLDFSIGNTAVKILALFEQPSVDRSAAAKTIRLLRWHRPMMPGTAKAPLLDRIAIRSGYLRKSTVLQLP
jgi:glycosyltransferase involved in cell wall biosynthesis